jgi:hypothetical protein
MFPGFAHGSMNTDNAREIMQADRVLLLDKAMKNRQSRIKTKTKTRFGGMDHPALVFFFRHVSARQSGDIFETAFGGMIGISG